VPYKGHLSLVAPTDEVAFDTLATVRALEIALDSISQRTLKLPTINETCPLLSSAACMAAFRSARYSYHPNNLPSKNSKECFKEVTPLLSQFVVNVSQESRIILPNLLNGSH
jgi:hypothetical protein